MPEYFDSTVAVSAIFPGSANYADASARLKAAGDGAYIINHGVADVFRTLTGRLRLPPKAAELDEMALLDQLVTLLKAKVWENTRASA